MTKSNPSPAFLAAREAAKTLAKMSDAEREALAAQTLQPITIEGHPLSLKNTMLLYLQDHSATVVGGFKQWLSADRVVCKGSSALWIFAPSVRKVETESGDNEEIHFRLVPVFDVSQTQEMGL